MNKENFYQTFINEKDKLLSQGKTKLLLHSCCAPCSSSVLELLTKEFDVTVYFFNPNLDGDEEFKKRAVEQERLCSLLGVPLIMESFNPSTFNACVAGLEGEKEGGKRCEKCFYLRLNETAKKAKELSFNAFATTLTVSPLKNASLINSIGKIIEKETSLFYLVSDFKKKDGYKRSIELSFKHGLYRQNYCGCKFSKKEN